MKSIADFSAAQEVMSGTFWFFWRKRLLHGCRTQVGFPGLDGIGARDFGHAGKGGRRRRGRGRPACGALWMRDVTSVCDPFVFNGGPARLAVAGFRCSGELAGGAGA